MLSDLTMTWVPVVLMGLCVWVGERHGYERGRRSR